MNNVEIRAACMKAGLKHWRVAEALGISETHFSRKLREELPETEKEKILAIVDHLAQTKQEAG